MGVGASRLLWNLLVLFVHAHASAFFPACTCVCAAMRCVCTVHVLTDGRVPLLVVPSSISFQVATGLLVLFFLYDIFMVFITPLIFKSSVMIEVATAGLPTDFANRECYCRLHPGAWFDTCHMSGAVGLVRAAAIDRTCAWCSFIHSCCTRRRR